jgi:hypothetical protein
VTLAVDVDGDGVAEPLYGSPQACVWNMDPRDACDVHAGTYKRGGTIADWNVAGSPGRRSLRLLDRDGGALGYGRNPAIGTDGQGTEPRESGVLCAAPSSTPTRRRRADAHERRHLGREREQGAGPRRRSDELSGVFSGDATWTARPRSRASARRAAPSEATRSIR